MPRYHALDTAISLCVWDPQVDPNSEADGNERSDTPAADFLTNITKKLELLRPKQKETSGPAIGYVVDNLKEDYFEGHEGVDFLDPAMPFYLVKAGKELFGPAEDDTASQPSPVPKDVTPTKAASTVLANDSEDTRPSSQVSAADITLSSIDTEFFTPKRDSFSTPEQGKPNVRPETNVEYPERDPKSSRSSHESRNAVASPKPIAIKLELSRKSFMSSINTSQRQELCITIFYNGELTHSRILRPDTYGSPRGPVGDEKIQYYSGRRINTSIEVPWVVNLRPRNGGTKFVGFDERWNKINQLLRAEADEWGYYGRFRSPMGEYLEELSKRVVPDLKDNEQLGGSRAGIIDVVITLGQSVRGAVLGLREPCRKLHEDHCGKAKQLIVAPEELGPKKRARIVAQFNRETPRKPVPQSLNKTQRPKFGLDMAQAQWSNINKRSMVGQSPKIDKTALEERGIGKRPGYTVNHNSTPRKKPPTPPLIGNHNKAGPSESFPPFADGTDGNHAAFNGFQSPKGSERAELAKRPQPEPQRRASLPMPSSPPTTHQHPPMPKNIPQKRYKGTESLEDPPPKRRKLENDLKALGCLPLEFEQPASSARLTRAASSPATPAPFPDTIPGRSVRGGQRRDESKRTNAPDEPISHVHQHENTQKAVQPATDTTIFSIDADFQSRSQSMLFGLDGTTDEPRRVSRPPSSTTIARSRRSLSKSEVESAVATPASSLEQLSQQDHTESVAPKDLTRIVFDVKHQEASSAFVDRRKFEVLQLQGSATQANSSSVSTKKSARRNSAPSHQEGDPFSEIRTYDGSSECLTRKGPMAGKTPLPPQSKSNTTKERAKTVPPLSEVTPEREGGKTVFTSESGDKAVFNPESDAVDEGSFSGKTIFFKPAPYRTRERKSSKACEKTRKVSNATSEGSNPVQPPPKTQPKSKRKSVSSTRQTVSTPEVSATAKAPANAQSKPKRNSVSSTKQASSTPEGPPKAKAPSKAQPTPRSGSVSSRKKGSAASEGSGKPETVPKSQPSRKREIVSSRELKQLFSPHKGSAAVDGSFGSSFKETVADAPKTRSSRKAKPTYATPEIPEDGVNSIEAAPSETQSLTPSSSIGVATMTRKTSSCRKTPVFFNRLAGANDKDGLQADHATGELLREAVQFERTPSNTPSQSKSHDRAITKAPKEQVMAASAVKHSSTQPGNKKDGESTEEATREYSIATENSHNVSSHITPSGRPGRIYTIDSEGRKVPTPKEGPLPDPANSLPNHLEGATPELHRSAQPSSPDRRSSLPQMMPETRTSTVPRRKLPSAFPKKTLPTSTPGQQNGGISAAASNAKVTTPPARPKVSVSDDTITFATPARVSAASAPIRTPTPQSQAKTKAKADEVSTATPQSKAKTKRKADEMMTASDDDSKSSSRKWKSDWKPISLCNDSALTYAVGEAFPGTAIDKASNQVCRTVKAEREGVFRASGVLMGVRFVVGL